MLPPTVGVVMAGFGYWSLQVTDGTIVCGELIYDAEDLRKAMASTR